MLVLFREIETKNKEMEIKLREMESKMREVQEENKKLKEIKGNIINNNIQNNNIGTQNNINIHINRDALMDFGSVEMEDRIEEILKKKAKEIFYASREFKNDEEEIKDRVYKLVNSIYRNSEIPELQNVFTQNAKDHLLNVEAPIPIKAFFWNEKKWNLSEWEKLGKYLIETIYNSLPGDLSNKSDILKIRKKLYYAYKADPLREKPKKLINGFLNKYVDSKDETDLILLYFALCLGEETINKLF